MKKIMETYIYIKKSQAGKFLEFPEKFNEDLFDNVGDTWEDYEAGKWVLLSPEQVEFHEKHPKATVKEVWDMKLGPKVVPPTPTPVTPEPSEDSEPEPWKPEMTVLEKKLKEIDDYSEPYSLTLKGKEMWLDAEERREILNLVSAYRAAKEKEMTKWIDEVEYTFTLTQWTKIAQRTEVYASKVENTKKTHKKNIQELQEDQDIEEYDYTTGYPEKLKFEDL